VEGAGGAGPPIAATSDIHSPRFLPGFLRSLGGTGDNPALILLAGDIVDRGRWRECTRVVEPIMSRWPGTPIVAVYGNEEYDDVKDKIRRACSAARWLDDEYIVVSLSGLEVGIIGTRGVLDRPTPWQARHIPGIAGIYRRRLERLRELISESKRSDDMTLLLTHYPPRSATLEGEDPRFWQQMSSTRLAKIVEEMGVDVVIHGHLHRSRVHDAALGPSRVYNVAFPAVEEIRMIRLEHRRGILGFLG